MRNSTAAYLALVAALSVPGLGLAASSKPAGAAQAKATVPGAARRYLPEYAPNGDLLLPGISRGGCSSARRSRPMH
jgi:hypothetical protein